MIRSTFICKFTIYLALLSSAVSDPLVVHSRTLNTAPNAVQKASPLLITHSDNFSKSTTDYYTPPASLLKLTLSKVQYIIPSTTNKIYSYLQKHFKNPQLCLYLYRNPVVVQFLAAKPGLSSPTPDHFFSPQLATPLVTTIIPPHPFNPPHPFTMATHWATSQNKQQRMFLEHWQKQMVAYCDVLADISSMADIAFGLNRALSNSRRTTAGIQAKKLAATNEIFEQFKIAKAQTGLIVQLSSLVEVANNQPDSIDTNSTPAYQCLSLKTFSNQWTHKTIEQINNILAQTKTEKDRTIQRISKILTQILVQLQIWMHNKSDLILMQGKTIAQLKRDVKSNQSKIMQCESIYLTIKNECDEQAAALTLANNNLTGTQSKLNEAKQALDDLNSQLLASRSERDASAKQVTDLQTQKGEEIKELEAKLKVKGEEIASNEKEIKKLEAELKVKREEIASNEKEINGLEEKLKVKREEINELEKSFNAASQERSQLENDHQNQLVNVTSALQQILGSNSDDNDVESLLVKVNSAIAQKNQEASRLKSDNSNCKALLAQLIDEFRSIDNANTEITQIEKPQLSDMTEGIKILDGIAKGLIAEIAQNRTEKGLFVLQAQRMVQGALHYFHDLIQTIDPSISPQTKNISLVPNSSSTGFPTATSQPTSTATIDTKDLSAAFDSICALLGLDSANKEKALETFHAVTDELNAAINLIDQQQSLHIETIKMLGGNIERATKVGFYLLSVGSCHIVDLTPIKNLPSLITYIQTNRLNPTQAKFKDHTTLNSLVTKLKPLENLSQTNNGNPPSQLILTRPEVNAFIEVLFDMISDSKEKLAHLTNEKNAWQTTQQTNQKEVEYYKNAWKSQEQAFTQFIATVLTQLDHDNENDFTKTLKSGDESNQAQIHAVHCLLEKYCNTLTDQRKELDHLTSVNADLSDKLNKAAQDNRNNQTTIQSYLKQAEKHQEQIDLYKEKIKEHQEQAEEHQRQIDLYNGQIEEHQRQIKEHQEQAEKNQEQAEERLQEIAKEHQRQIDLYNGQIEEHQRQIEEHQEQAEERLQEIAKEHQRQIEEHQRQIEEHQRQIEEHQRQIDLYKGQIEFYKEQVEERLQEIATLENSTSELALTNERQNLAIAQLTADNAMIDAQNKALEDTLSTQTNVDKTAQVAITSFNSFATDVNSRLEQGNLTSNDISRILSNHRQVFTPNHNLNPAATLFRQLLNQQLQSSDSNNDLPNMTNSSSSNAGELTKRLEECAVSFQNNRLLNAKHRRINNFKCPSPSITFNVHVQDFFNTSPILAQSNDKLLSDHQELAKDVYSALKELRNMDPSFVNAMNVLCTDAYAEKIFAGDDPAALQDPEFIHHYLRLVYNIFQTLIFSKAIAIYDLCEKSYQKLASLEINNSGLIHTQASAKQTLSHVYQISQYNLHISVLFNCLHRIAHHCKELESSHSNLLNKEKPITEVFDQTRNFVFEHSANLQQVYAWLFICHTPNTIEE
ncbi:hypothetical protein NEHOM01_1490 [Nematocida homosporus]|uniref:uncharacterized protein n=1 Tax=Nematocida homosporus TaxID=1912981 RepID=UPI00222114E2|nr:uncharacterized protein NEHOM01_1490 [Nematocida homosporus]KAI5186478.1 hypothetical protein NEHOM01_1490 [Nematocida homosporus]